MITTRLPPEPEMYRALLERDAAFEGLFFAGIRTTGIFCRPTCPARKPKRENVEFFGAARDALASGYRPCQRCRPLQPSGDAPGWLRGLLDAVDQDPTRRWKDTDIQAMSIDPVRVRRWFKKHHGITFHSYLRSRRLAMALELIRENADLTDTAYEAGYEAPSAFRDAFEKLFGTTPGRGRNTRVVHVSRLLTPLGPMLAGATAEGICLLEFADRRMLEIQLLRLGRRLEARPVPGTHEHVRRLEAELGKYFQGSRKQFSVPLVVPGSDFQVSVWDRLREIPYGVTISYDDVARDIGRPGAQRAVGRANGDNRVAIVIPCHRVIRSDGSLSGYGGGRWRKQALLDHERSHTDAAQAGLFDT